MDDEHVRQFTGVRPLLFTIAYEITGTATDAEDVLQESFLRWAAVDTDGIDDPKSYLATVVTRQALNVLRSRTRRREEYVGPWLPEPILTDRHEPIDDVVLGESVSMAMLLVLETLGPDERAVFVLREVFGFGHDEIADMVQRSPDAVRQMAHRAREHVRARRRRFAPVSGRRAEEVTTRFLTAAVTGDVDELMAVLAPDVVWISDGNGKASAARRPIRGADQVARFAQGLVRLAGSAELGVDLRSYNGAPAVVFRLDGELAGVNVIDVVDDRIVGIYAMRNPDKLHGVAVSRELGR